MTEETIVRQNLMNEKGYTPYCYRCTGLIRVKWNEKLDQFRCPVCSWTSEFPKDFIDRYKTKWLSNKENK